MVSPAISEALSGATANVAIHWQDPQSQRPAQMPSANDAASGFMDQAARLLRERPWTAVGSIFVAGILLSFLFPRK